MTGTNLWPGGGLIARRTAEALPAEQPACVAVGGRHLPTARVMLCLVAAALVLATSYVAWHAYILQRDLRETDRHHAMWNVSQAVTGYASLHRALATDRAGAADASARFDIFARQVHALRDGDTGAMVAAIPEMNALVQRLEADLGQLRVLANVPGDPGAVRDVSRVVAAETVELVRLAEAANRVGTMRAELAERITGRLRLLFTSLLVVLVATGLLLIVNLARRIRELDATRRTLETTASGLRDALAAAGRAEAARSRFIATVSHEIRTPMNAVLGIADSLLDDRLTRAQHEMVTMIRDSGDNLLRMLNDILDYSKLESGRMTLETQPFSPESVTAITVVTIAAKARAKGLTIVAIPAPGLPSRLLGDPGRVGQILLNLVSNAVKFTEAGGVSLQVLCPERDEHAATIEWVVTDSGVGIASDQIGQLFEDFVQADETIANRFGGTGLGLAICRRLVTQMGGTINVESTPGEGSRFRVRLTFSMAPHASESLAVPPPNEAVFQERLRAMGRKPTVLVAEDNPTNQFVIRQVLAREGITPVIVGDGSAAVTAAEANRYDIICMDMRMPEMDGLEATRRIRSGQGASANVPIIALTASAFPEDVRACLDAGMDLFVPKPVRRDALLGAMLSVLNNSTAEQNGLVQEDAGQTVG